MIFNTWEFVVFFILLTGIFYSTAPQYRKWILLTGSFIFIGFNHWGYLALAVLISLLTFQSGLWISKTKNEKSKKHIFLISLLCHLCILIFFKYFGFLETNLNLLVKTLGYNWDYNTTANIFLPLGISFYIFQSISYLIEVYWEEQEVEKDLISFMLYMLFFMKFLSGPIERPDNFLPQTKKKQIFDYDNVSYGLKLIAVGLFKKLIIADRLAPHLNEIFSSVHDYSGAQLGIATLIYPLQLYADFSGYTDIAIGGAAILGYRLSPNFNRPFIAQTITDFWRRWHMSLSFWVKDYIYEPLAFKKRNWGIWGIIFSLMTTFILLGLWHGGNWNFIIYGAIQGIVIVYEMQFGKWRSRWGKSINPTWFKFYGMLRTYLIFSISLLFFKLDNFSDVVYVLTHYTDGIKTSLKELNIGLRDHDLIVFTTATVILFLYEYALAKWDIWKQLEQKSIAIRWCVYYLILISIFTCGDFGTKDFIYLQF